MKPWIKGLVIAVVQMGLVASLGAKLLYDRAVRPRVWAQAIPYDPNLPIRGRYVRLQLVVEPRGIQENQTGKKLEPRPPVILHVEDDRLVAEAKPQMSRYDPAELHLTFIGREGKKHAVLDKPVAFFIPEHILDPSLRPSGEDLWVEVTIPRKGLPRPIRLGVKKNDDLIVPLD
jgi:hypothetical protein